MRFSKLFFVGIHDEPFVAVGDFPCGMENQPGALGKQLEVNLIYGICRCMVVGMQATEVENYRDAAFRKVILVRPVVDAHGVFRVIIHVVQLHVGIVGVGIFVDGFQLGTQFVRSDYVPVVVVAAEMLIVNPANHIGIEIDDGVFQRAYGVARVVVGAQLPFFLGGAGHEKNTDPRAV